MGAEEFCRQFGELKGMARALEKLEAGESPATTAAALEFICEGLHLGKRLNKTPSTPAAFGVTAAQPLVSARPMKTPSASAHSTSPSRAACRA